VSLQLELQFFRLVVLFAQKLRDFFCAGIAAIDGNTDATGNLGAHLKATVEVR
jgi:hypothetical protein